MGSILVLLLENSMFTHRETEKLSELPTADQESLSQDSQYTHKQALSTVTPCHLRAQTALHSNCLTASIHQRQLCFLGWVSATSKKGVGPP